MSSGVSGEDILKYVRMLDVFPKTVDDAKEKSVSGGGVSIFVFVLVAILFLSEVNYPKNLSS